MERKKVSDQECLIKDPIHFEEGGFIYFLELRPALCQALQQKHSHTVSHFSSLKKDHFPHIIEDTETQ